MWSVEYKYTLFNLCFTDIFLCIFFDVRQKSISYQGAKVFGHRILCFCVQCVFKLNIKKLFLNLLIYFIKFVNVCINFKFYEYK